MPIFEYKCHKCGKIFTKLLKDPLKKYECECGVVADKIVSAPAWRYSRLPRKPRPLAAGMV